jgi:ClpP class serine protease
MNVPDLFWIIFLLFTIWPMFKQRSINRNRLLLLRKIERARGTRVISLIHRQEAISLLGIPISRYINIEDSEHILRAIRLTPDNMPIDLILHTPGGLVLASEQISRAIMDHPAKVTVFVPHYAMSGGTMIALAASEIVMDQNAVLGPVDPQLGRYPAASILSVLEKKNINRLDDETLIFADMAQKAIRQVEDFVTELLERKLPRPEARSTAKVITEGRWTHDYPITCDKLEQLGLKVSTDLPREVYILMELYPQPAQRRPSVQYIPLPYKQGERSD